MTKGIITTIQRMSIHDGPGIRSTVFLKGCNLRCKWCHNPETFEFHPELEWQKDLCINCGSCAEVCRPKALKMVNGRLNFSRSDCNTCFDCIDVCYPNALRKTGKEYTPEALVDELMQDLVFFRQSGGGVTFSGGEPMLQASFMKEVALLLKKQGIHIAMETNLSVSWDKYEEMLPFIDLVMADVKMIDEEKHRKWTGSGNRLILENIRKLDEANTPYILRTPVVPGVNDFTHIMEQIIAFAGTLKNLRKYELLPYHPLADFKYENLGRKYPFEGVSGANQKSLEIYDPIIEKYNINS